MKEPSLAVPPSSTGSTGSASSASSASSATASPAAAVGAALGSDLAEAAQAGAAAAPPHILVVEDSATQARYLAGLLEQAGYRVRIAPNGREGLAAARGATPQLIISDIAMPEMDGFALCQEVKRDAVLRDVPVILLTSLTSLYDVIKGLDCGADNFLRKPFDDQKLLARIRFILANRALRDDDRVQMGMRINLGGQTHFITAERQQIFDLLISTYEEAIQMTEQLQAQQLRIASSYQSLEGLYRIAEALNPVLSERAAGALAIDLLLDFPGVLGASIKLQGADGRLRLLMNEGDGEGVGEADGSSAAAPAAGGCLCERALAAGEAATPGLLAHCQQVNGPHACIALSTGAAITGVLCLQMSAEVDAEQRQLLAAVASQIAVAIERARLYGSMELQVRERTEAWQGERQLLSAVVNTSGALVCMIDGQGLIRLFNPACEAALGWSAAQALGRPCGEVLRDADSDVDLPGQVSSSLARLCAQPPAQGGPVQLRGKWRSRDGALRAIIWSATWLRKGDGSVEYFVCTGVDVTELRGAEEKLQYMSSFDALTGLPNRELMRDRFRELQTDDNVVGGRQQVALLIIKPERLRVIAENLGLDAEYAMLRQAASRLRHRQRGAVSVGRVGERTFAVAMAGRADDVAVMARQLLAELGLPFLLGGRELHLDPAIGIALYPNDGSDYETIYQGADAAVRRAMSGKQERYEFYRPELNQDAHARFHFESALRGAIERHELVLHYQVQADLRSGAIIGVEALVRWQHPQQGLIGPGLFIPLAEETGMILPIGEWVLRCACEQAMAWQRQGLAPVPVSVNLSARQFSDNAVALVERILAETGLAPQLLELELTESASMEEPEKTIGILRLIKATGVKVAIDDFGTGYSNLSYLKRFPLDKLKLDQSFVRDIVSDPHDLSIARAVIAMGHSLGLTVIAEGVETREQLELLAANGCDEMQGYYLSRPIDGSACAALMAAHLPAHVLG